MRALILAASPALLALGACAPDLGRLHVHTEVRADGSCSADISNGKDLSNLDLENLELCGRPALARLHLDASQGAQAAITAMTQNNATWASVVPGIVSDAITAAGSVITGRPGFASVPAAGPPAIPAPR